jgi:hypothetical protein
MAKNGFGDIIYQQFKNAYFRNVFFLNFERSILLKPHLWALRSTIVLPFEGLIL